MYLILRVVLLYSTYDPVQSDTNSRNRALSTFEWKIHIPPADDLMCTLHYRTKNWAALRDRLPLRTRYLMGSRFSVEKCRDRRRQSELVWLLILVRRLLACSRLWFNHEMERQRSWASLWRATMMTNNFLGYVPADSYYILRSICLVCSVW